MPAVQFTDVDIVFGAKQKEALAMIDAGATRGDILTKTGATLGAAKANLSVQRGEICVLMGLSGSGKSTLLRAVNRLNQVARGKVLVEHRGKKIDVSSCDDNTLRDIRMNTVSMVFQQFGLLPWRSVKDNVGFGLELRGVKGEAYEKTVAAKLEMVGLTQWANKQVQELSGGMQQRVGLARAFATDADILLMDEPFSALDPLIRTKLQDELLVLQKELKKTIIFVSHDLDEALKIGNHIAILEGGRMVQYGKPEDIILRPADDYVREFVANVNPLHVLTAHHVMRDFRDLEASEDGWIWLDVRHTARVKLDEDGKVALAELLGRPAEWQMCELTPADNKIVSTPEKPILFWAKERTPLKTVMGVMHHEVAPVALFDEDLRFVGAIGAKDVLGAVLRKEG